MARPLRVEGTATPAEVEAAYQAATDRHCRERLLAVHLALDGEHSLRQIARALWRGTRTVKRWLKAYREGGIAKLLERKHRDRKASLSPAVQDELREGLLSGRWRKAQEIQAWLEEQHQIRLKLGGVRYWVRKLRGSWKLPQTSHVEKDPAEVEAFQKQFDQRLAALVGPEEKKKLYVWVEDEHRYGLNSVTRRVWTLQGHRPVVPYQKKREWEDLYGALEVGTGRAEFLYTPGVSLGSTRAFLEQLVATDPGGVHVVIWDEAGYHPLSDDPSLPEAIRVLPLPPYSPELNPTETLWDQVKDAVANAAWRTLDQVTDVIDGVLRSFWENAARVCRLLGRNWTTRAVAAFLGHPCGAVAN